MKCFYPVCLGLLLLGAAVSAPEDDAYAQVYSSAEATSELPPNLHIAKGLPPVSEVGLAAVKRVWESYRNSTPSKRLIPVRSRKSPFAPAAPAAQASRE